MQGFVAIPTRIAELSDHLAANRPTLSETELKQTLAQLLGLQADRSDLGPSPHHRNIKPRPEVGGGAFGRYAVETEDGIEAILLKDVVAERPSRINRSLDVEEPAVLLVPDSDAAAELHIATPKEGEAVYAVDLRGFGASRASPAGPTGCTHPPQTMLELGRVFDESVACV